MEFEIRLKSLWLGGHRVLLFLEGNIIHSAVLVPVDNNKESKILHGILFKENPYVSGC